MCLAIPGEILSIKGADPLMRVGRVSFGGIIKEINLAYTPHVAAGDYVLVHAGFAIGIIDKEEARRVFSYLEEIEELTELQAEDQSPGLAHRQGDV